MTDRPRFCSACGGSVEEEGDRFLCQRCGRRHYLNSKPCAGGLVVRDEQVMLVRRGREPFKGWWDVPGGFLDAGEHPEEGTVREVLEETGLRVRPVRLVGIYMDVYGDGGDPTLNLYYECEIVGGREMPGDDAVEIGWFEPNALPAKVAFANCRQLLADWQRGHLPPKGVPES